MIKIQLPFGSTKKNKQFGSSLLEVMVALLVLAIGLLGVLAMQVQTLKFNQSAYLYSQAAFLANDMYESMQLFPENGRDFEMALSGSVADADDCSAKACEKDKIIAWVKNQWCTNVITLLPEGKCAIVADNEAQTYVIQIEFLVGYDKEKEIDTYTLQSGLAIDVDNI